MDSLITILHGDCLDILSAMPANSIDSVVTDPPAGIAFMGKDWDHHKGGRDQWTAWLAERLAECLRVAKPGAHALVWALPRTSHWTAMAIEDAGWVIEDRVAHIFGTGFPKHKSKLKPAVEDWWLATKPGGAKWLGVDACRIEGVPRSVLNPSFGVHTDRIYGMQAGTGHNGEMSHATGRWPTNLVLSHHPECNGDCHPDCPVAMLDEQSGKSVSPTGNCIAKKSLGILNDDSWISKTREWVGYSDSGGASRFFPGFLYCPKANRKDRGEGNTHPTVKAEPLMRWLCKLVTPPGGTVLDPFAGSGSTGFAAEVEGFKSILIEQNVEYVEIIKNRLAQMDEKTPLFC